MSRKLSNGEWVEWMLSEQPKSVCFRHGWIQAIRGGFIRDSVVLSLLFVSVPFVMAPFTSIFSPRDSNGGWHAQFKAYILQMQQYEQRDGSSFQYFQPKPW